MQLRAFLRHVRVPLARGTTLSIALAVATTLSVTACDDNEREAMLDEDEMPDSDGNSDDEPPECSGLTGTSNKPTNCTSMGDSAPPANGNTISLDNDDTPGLSIGQTSIADGYFVFTPDYAPDSDTTLDIKVNSSQNAFNQDPDNWDSWGWCVSTPYDGGANQVEVVSSKWHPTSEDAASTLHLPVPQSGHNAHVFALRMWGCNTDGTVHHSDPKIVVRPKSGQNYAPLPSTIDFSSEPCDSEPTNGC